LVQVSPPATETLPPATAGQPQKYSFHAPTGPTANPEDAADDGAMPQKKENFLAFLQNEKHMKAENLTKAQKNLVNNFTCTPAVNGQYSVMENGNPVATVDSHGVGITDKNPPDSTQHIDAILKAATVAKGLYGDKPVHSGGGDEMQKLMLAKGAELVGMNCGNPPPPGQTLNDKYPAVAKKMEDEWAKMQAQNQPKPDSPQTRKSAAADVTGLTQPSTIATDKTPPLTPQFAAKANPQIAATTPAPATPGVSPPQIARPGAPM
jgi:hypothetical protein